MGPYCREINAVQDVPLAGAFSPGAANTKACSPRQGWARPTVGGARAASAQAWVLRPSCRRGGRGSVVVSQGSLVGESAAPGTWRCPHIAVRELHKEGDGRKFGWRIKEKGGFSGTCFYFLSERHLSVFTCRRRETSPQIKHRITMQSSNPTSGHRPRGIGSKDWKSCLHTRVRSGIIRSG